VFIIDYKNLQQFQSVVYSKSFDVICLTETWLSDTIFDNKILPTNFTLYHQDCQSHGGGVRLLQAYTCLDLASRENLTIMSF